MLRELRRRLMLVRNTLPLSCLLCSSRTPGGLCPHCTRAVLGSGRREAHRCPRCALSLAVPIKPSEEKGIVAESLRRAAKRLGMAIPPHDAQAEGLVPCPDCPGLSPALERVIAAFDYAWPGDLLIEQLKVHTRFSTAVVLADLLAGSFTMAPSPGLPQWRELSQWCWVQQAPMLVTAVPASRRSLVLRGFNPAAELGRALARRLAWEWRPDLLTRALEGQSQKSLGRGARRREVQGLYQCPGGVIGKQVLVVDDVMTTGATLSAIADALAEQGAARVWAAVAARTPARHDLPITGPGRGPVIGGPASA